MAKRRKGADQTIIEVNAISDVEEEETALPAAAPPPAPPPAEVGHTSEYLDALKAVGGQEELKDTCWQTIRTRAAHYFPDRPLTESEIQRDRERERWV